ncbi:FAD-dependent oxidoreductase [Scytonema sp. PCC 10023]|uniref:FAD-dependent oxidoreductase n=1 Tax=Scytonema sp. PCC 10023 TaxID=1680591 RepID=UPI0039C5F6FA
MSSKTAHSSHLGSHAVVIGGSMAGLLAARVLTDHFDRVTIIERDLFPEKPMPRKGVPQSQHFHGLLMRGRIILEEFFPGLQDELVAAGAPVLDMGADTAWFTPAGCWAARFQSGLHTLMCSRDLLDWSIRRRLSAFANVSFLEECNVTGLLPNSDGMAVIGVSVRFCNQLERGNTNEEQLYADLVVDASGRASKAFQWLKALGYMPPEETVVDASLGYASRIYQIPSGFRADWKGIYIHASPPTCTRTSALSPIEGNRWMVSLCGADPDYPPTNEAGFLEFTRGLASPMTYNAIKDAEPISSIFSYHAQGNRLRHYERLPRQPEGFVVVGDAVCTFSPIYAQGMTIAALGAITLDRCLREERRAWRGNMVGLARRFQKKLGKVNSVPWLAATSQDYRYPGVKGNSKTPGYAERLMQWYMDQVILLAAKNPNVCLVFFEVMHMLKPSAVLFQPSIFVQVLRQVLISFMFSHLYTQQPLKLSEWK